MQCECGKPFVRFQLHAMRDGRVIPLILSTMVGYAADAPGHCHDDNCQGLVYYCEDGHETAVSKRKRCPAEGCGWVGKATCWCHKDEKVDEWPLKDQLDAAIAAARR